MPLIPPMSGSNPDLLETEYPAPGYAQGQYPVVEPEDLNVVRDMHGALRGGLIGAKVGDLANGTKAVFLGSLRRPLGMLGAGTGLLLATRRYMAPERQLPQDTQYNTIQQQSFAPMQYEQP